MKKKKDIISIILSIIILLCVILLFNLSGKKTSMLNAPVVFNSNKCLVTVKNKGNILRLTNKQIEDLLYLLEHSCTKTQEKGGFRDDINEDAPLYIDVQYESEICLQNDKGNSFNIYRIIYTYDDKFNNKLTYHIRNDSIGFHYYNMSNSDMKKLEHILNICFND